MNRIFNLITRLIDCDPIAVILFAVGAVGVAAVIGLIHSIICLVG